MLLATNYEDAVSVILKTWYFIIHLKSNSIGRTRFLPDNNIQHAVDMS